MPNHASFARVLLENWPPRFRLLFPHPTPEADEKLKKSLEHLERWLVREGTWSDWSVPQHMPEAVNLLQASVQQLRSLTVVRRHQ